MSSCNQRTRDHGNKAKRQPDARALLLEAVAYESVAFKHLEDVNGADLVDWFAEWRQRVLKALQ